MSDLRDEMGRLLLPFLDESMTFAQSCQLADQLVRLTRQEVAYTGPTDAMVECGADQLEVRYGDSWTSREDYREAAKTVFLAMNRAAIAMEARQGGDGETRLHAKHDSAVRSNRPNSVEERGL